MQPALGAKLGDGATAEVYALSPGRVVKLFRPFVPQRVARHEARMTRAAFAAGASAPELFDEVTIDGRAGLVMARLDGPSLIQATRAKTLSFIDAGAVLAASLHAIHATPPPPDIPLLRDAVLGSLRTSRVTLPSAVAAGLTALLDQLAPEAGLCHGDPNPGNVILTSDGPRMVDWIAAVRAPPAFDLASAKVMLMELAPTVADDPGRPRAIHAAFAATYAEFVGATSERLAAAVDAYLPLARAIAVLGGALPTLEDLLLQRLSEDFPA